MRLEGDPVSFKPDHAPESWLAGQFAEKIDSDFRIAL